MKYKPTEEHKENLRKVAHKRWADPEWRAMMVQKQVDAGLRKYKKKL